MLPPNWFFDKLTRTKLGLDQNEPFTDPFSEFPERSRVCNCDMFLRNFHEMDPLRFLEERFMFVIGEFEQFPSATWNQERLNPETDLKAFSTSSRSVLLHEDSTSAISEKAIKNPQKSFIFFASQFFQFSHL